MNLGRRPVNPKLAHLVRAALMAHGLSIRAWASAMTFNRTSVSLALHGRRTDARSRMIRAELLKLVKGAGR